MLQSSDIEKTLVKLKPELSRKFHVGKIGYFGSYARHEQTEISDIDILVELTQPLGWEFFDLQDTLEAALHHKVDLVTVNALKVPLKDAILREVKYV